MKQALLCVSFGTSVPSARQSIEAVEAVLRAAAPGYDFFRAFTNAAIRRILAERGEMVLSLPQALDRLADAGYDEVVVQPTHLLAGTEYEKLRAEAQAAAGAFGRLRLGLPLLADAADETALTRLLCDAYPACPGEALVWMGHGTGHAANGVYLRLQARLEAAGRTDVFVGTVKGSPALEDVRVRLKKTGFAGVHLVPLLLVAGGHALHDMAGSDPGSWKSVLEADGLQVRCTLQGLGLLPAIQALYASHLRKIL